jgi:hypothetical protein
MKEHVKKLCLCDFAICVRLWVLGTMGSFHTAYDYDYDYDYDFKIVIVITLKPGMIQMALNSGAMQCKLNPFSRR